MCGFVCLSCVEETAAALKSACLDVQQERPALDVASCADVSDKEIKLHYPGLKRFALQDAATAPGVADFIDEVNAGAESCVE